jgi:hypothetical protein
METPTAAVAPPDARPLRRRWSRFIRPTPARRGVTVVQAANAQAARRALTLFIAALAVAAAAPLVGADAVAPTLAMIAFALAPLAVVAARAGAVVVVDDEGVGERSFIGSRRIRWDEIRRVEWRRFGGVERLTLRVSPVRSITLSSDRRGWTAAAARIESIAGARAIPIVAGSR